MVIDAFELTDNSKITAKKKSLDVQKHLTTLIKPKVLLNEHQVLRVPVLMYTNKQTDRRSKDSAMLLVFI